MIVFDASAAVLALLNDGDARRSVASETIAVPHLADSEVAHAVRAQVLRGRISADDAGATHLGILPGLAHWSSWPRCCGALERIENARA